MNITEKSKKKLVNFIYIPLFFIALGIVLYLYSINLSVLFLAITLFAYVRVRNSSKMPSLTHLGVLTLIGVATVIFTSGVFKLSEYAIPIIWFSILIALLFKNLELSLLFTIFCAFCAGAIIQNDFDLTITFLISGASAAFLSLKARKRIQIINAGLIAGFIQAAVAVFLERNYVKQFTPFDVEIIKFSLLNGIISAIAVIGMLPLFEIIFKMVTDISLLELSDFNHPLLKRMILEAPGTYQHSLVVANLAEAAAESIGANALLARVGAYYHDIGKIPKAEYYMENQIPYRDIHKNLKPSMSTLIIMNHVKEGIELAKKYHLNQKIIDFIAQHHGKSLVYYFFQRAKELEPEKNHQEEEYRYPGPRPQTKEVAIVQLADIVEAVSRTLEEPTPSRIEEMVKNVVKKKFMEGELDECELTLEDLEKITHSFIRVLNAMFHTRINYPQNENTNKANNSKTASKP